MRFRSPTALALAAVALFALAAPTFASGFSFSKGDLAQRIFAPPVLVAPISAEPDVTQQVSMNPVQIQAVQHVQMVAVRPAIDVLQQHYAPPFAVAAASVAFHRLRGTGNRSDRSPSWCDSGP